MVDKLVINYSRWKKEWTN